MSTNQLENNAIIPSHNATQSCHLSHSVDGSFGGWEVSQDEDGGHAIDHQRKVEFLFVNYKKLMIRIALKVLKNPMDAEDVVQQIFLQLTENIEDVDLAVEPRLRGFLYTITERRALDLLRAHKFRLSWPEIPEQSPDFDFPQDHTLSDCMERLPETYRKVLLLKYHCGYTTKEISCITQLSAANVLKICQRAKGKLKAMCEMENIL